MMQTNTLPARSYAGAIRTMIVEDDRASREALTEFLDGEGIPCCAARDAIEALELVAENPAIDVVILDVGLPGFDGFELIQKLAAQRDLNQFKLIVVTGNPTLDAAVKTLRSRAVEFLTKPVDPAELDALLATIDPPAIVAAE